MGQASYEVNNNTEGSSKTHGPNMDPFLQEFAGRRNEENQMTSATPVVCVSSECLVFAPIRMQSLQKREGRDITRFYSKATHVMVSSSASTLNTDVDKPDSITAHP